MPGVGKTPIVIVVARHTIAVVGIDVFDIPAGITAGDNRALVIGMQVVAAGITYRAVCVFD